MHIRKMCIFFSYAKVYFGMKLFKKGKLDSKCIHRKQNVKIQPSSYPNQIYIQYFSEDE